jgi:hypothetical protein
MATRQRAAPEARLAHEIDLLHFSIGVQRDYENTILGREGPFFLLSKRSFTTYLVTNTGVHHLCDMHDSLPCIHHTLLIKF